MRDERVGVFVDQPRTKSFSQLCPQFRLLRLSVSHRESIHTAPKRTTTFVGHIVCTFTNSTQTSAECVTGAPDGLRLLTMVWAISYRLASHSAIDSNWIA